MQNCVDDSRDTPLSSPAARESAGTAEDYGAVVLAAGEARRFGSPKLLMPFGDSTVLGSVVDALVSSGIGPIVVVAGANAAAIEELLGHGRVRVVRNPDPVRADMNAVECCICHHYVS